MKVISESKNVKQTSRRVPEPSKTLMRHAVKQPGALKAAARPAKHNRLTHRPAASLAPKSSINHIEASRLLHARSVKKSRSISRFSSSVFDYQALPAAALPIARPKLASPARPTVQRPSTDLLERAIQQAESHHQKAPRIKRRVSRKLSNLTVGTLAIVVLAGFFAYQNAASFAVHRATGKVGFAASLPGYHPSGFSLGRAVYSAGYFQVNFHSNSDQRSFAVIERPSVINSQPLAIDNQHNASWVKHGVAYEVQANGSLSDEQLRQLASSL